MDAIWEYYLKIDISILLLSISALFVVAICTVGFKTVRTAFMNPVNALRDE
jgi:hypothetical protein